MGVLKVFSSFYKLSLESLFYIITVIIISDNISELNELISAGAKLPSDRIGVPTKEPEQKYKTWMGNEARRTNNETVTTRESM